MTDLAAENAALKLRIEDLEFEAAEMKGLTDFDKEVCLELRIKFNLKPKQARLLLLISDGKFWAHSRLIYALDLQDRHSRVLYVHLHHVRKSGFKIINMHGSGYTMDEVSCELVRDVIRGMP